MCCLILVTIEQKNNTKNKEDVKTSENSDTCESRSQQKRKTIRCEPYYSHMYDEYLLKFRKSRDSESVAGCSNHVFTFSIKDLCCVELPVFVRKFFRNLNTAHTYTGYSKFKESMVEMIPLEETFKIAVETETKDSNDQTDVSDKDMDISDILNDPCCPNGCLNECKKFKDKNKLRPFAKSSFNFKNATVDKSFKDLYLHYYNRDIVDNIFERYCVNDQRFAVKPKIALSVLQKGFVCCEFCEKNFSCEDIRKNDEKILKVLNKNIQSNKKFPMEIDWKVSFDRFWYDDDLNFPVMRNKFESFIGIHRTMGYLLRYLKKNNPNLDSDFSDYFNSFVENKKIEETVNEMANIMKTIDTEDNETSNNQITPVIAEMKEKPVFDPERDTFETFCVETVAEFGVYNNEVFNACYDNLRLIYDRARKYSKLTSSFCDENKIGIFALENNKPKQILGNLFKDVSTPTHLMEMSTGNLIDCISKMKENDKYILSEDFVLCLSDKFHISCTRFDFSKMKLRKVNSINGAPGCGKTTYILREHLAKKDALFNTLVLSSTLEGRKEIRERAIDMLKGSKSFHSDKEIIDYSEKYYKTIQSVVVNGYKNEVKYLWVDEALMNHPADLL